MTKIDPYTNKCVKIDIESMGEDAYSNFVESIRNPGTRRHYERNLEQFLNLIPNAVFEKGTGAAPDSRDAADLADAFVRLAEENMDTAKSIIKSYVREINKEVGAGRLSPNSVANKIKPIKALLATNNIDISWKLINRMFPREIKSEDRAYTREEIGQMLAHCADVTDKLIILMFSSAGFRLEAWDYFCWKDVVMFPGDGDTYKGAALRVYRGDPEEYWTFITPEACETLVLYRKEWGSRFLREPQDDDPLVVSVRHDVPHRLHQKGVRARVDRIVTKIGLRDRLDKGKRRHAVKLDHGFRKYFNTMMRRAKVNYLDKEDMMGHKTGLESSYERYVEEDFERFPEYQKAIPFLTVDDSARRQLELERVREENSRLERTHVPRDEVRDMIREEVKKALRESMFEPA